MGVVVNKKKGIPKMQFMEINRVNVIFGKMSNSENLDFFLNTIAIRQYTKKSFIYEQTEYEKIRIFTTYTAPKSYGTTLHTC